VSEIPVPDQAGTAEFLPSFCIRDYDRLEGDVAGLFGEFRTAPGYNDYPVTPLTQPLGQMEDVFFPLATLRASFDKRLFISAKRPPSAVDLQILLSAGLSYRVIAIPCRRAILSPVNTFTGIRRLQKSFLTVELRLHGRSPDTV
jgi:hypothetical protein